MDVVERFADRVAVWSQGRIAALGPPAQVLADPAVQREVIGIERHAPQGGAAGHA
jgi:branched-chain amino acid transport system ATP-binding protein